MDLIIFEDSIKYDAWVKLFLVFPLVLLIVLGTLFYIDAHYSDIFPKDTPQLPLSPASRFLASSTSERQGSASSLIPQNAPTHISPAP